METHMKPTIGILGLGKIGRAAGENLLKEGYRVLAVRRPSTEDFAGVGGALVATAAELARQCDLVITCLPDEASMHAGFEGPDGLAAGAHAGLTVLEMGTFAAELKAQLAALLKPKGAAMLDSPISGTPSMVASKVGVLFVSGDRAVADRCTDVINAFAPKNYYVGEFGSGMAIKLVTNFIVGANSLVVAEAFVFGIKAGLDPDLMIKVIGPSAAQSRVFDFRAPMIAQRKFKPAPGPAHILWKDLQFIRDESDRMGLAAPVLKAQLEWFGKMMSQGKQDDEVAAVFEMLESATQSPKH
jgi:3-hydroxyisobutyrate dehydrogenase-like beta-hydroxyacid dehydrogenase